MTYTSWGKLKGFFLTPLAFGLITESNRSYLITYISKWLTLDSSPSLDSQSGIPTLCSALTH